MAAVVGPVRQVDADEPAEGEDLASTRWGRTSRASIQAPKASRGPPRKSTAKGITRLGRQQPGGVRGGRRLEVRRAEGAGVRGDGVVEDHDRAAAGALRLGAVAGDRLRLGVGPARARRGSRARRPRAILVGGDDHFEVAAVGALRGRAPAGRSPVAPRTATQGNLRPVGGLGGGESVIGVGRGVCGASPDSLFKTRAIGCRVSGSGCRRHRENCASIGSADTPKPDHPTPDSRQLPSASTFNSSRRPWWRPCWVFSAQLQRGRPGGAGGGRCRRGGRGRRRRGPRRSGRWPRPGCWPPRRRRPRGPPPTCRGGTAPSPGCRGRCPARRPGLPARRAASRSSSTARRSIASASGSLRPSSARW